MTDEIAQLVALVCHGNAFLRGESIPDFFSSNSTCQFCKDIIFWQAREVVVNPNPNQWFDGLRHQVPVNPNQWFAGLRDRAVSGLRMFHVPRNDREILDRMSTAFDRGGGHWRIEVVRKNGFSEMLRALWQVENRKAPDGRIWSVSYSQGGYRKTENTAVRPLVTLKESLETALLEISDFSKKHAVGFTKHFSNALESLPESVAKHGHHKDLSVAGILSPDAAALLDSCQAAWVFGDGRGNYRWDLQEYFEQMSVERKASWNDLIFDGEDGREYDRVSENLFRSLCEIIPAAANDSFKPVNYATSN